jgi:REP element-mobilizing transposase RayT
MARLLRTDLPDGYFHVTTRGVDGCPIFRDDRDRLRFLRLLRETVARYAWDAFALCLMTNHYHLVVAAARANLSDGLHRLNGVYAQRFNRHHGRTGHLFGDRFAARVIDRETHLAAACEYVVQNPVRAGLCERAEDWPWSASRHAR